MGWQSDLPSGEGCAFLILGGCRFESEADFLRLGRCGVWLRGVARADLREWLGWCVRVMP